MSEAAAQAEAVSALAKPLTRREFLYYLWGISLAVFTAGTTGATIWFVLPRFREGEFGGAFSLGLADLPAVDEGPKGYPQGRFWLVNIGSQILSDPRQETANEFYPVTQGVKALYMVCVHLGCLYKWVPVNVRFECPCHGSKYLETGTRIEGPANRNLDVFVVEVLDAGGNVLGRTEPSLDGRNGTAVAIPPEAASLRVDTGKRIMGAPNSRPKGWI